MEYNKFKIDELLKDNYKDHITIIEFEGDNYVNSLWKYTCIFFEYILKLELSEMSEPVKKLLSTHHCSEIKQAFISSDIIKIGEILSNFYSYILGHYPIIPIDICNNKYIHIIYNELFNVHDIIKYYISVNNPFKYGKCIRFSSIYKKLLIKDIDYNYDSIEILNKQLSTVFLRHSS